MQGSGIDYSYPEVFAGKDYHQSQLEDEGEQKRERQRKQERERQRKQERESEREQQRKQRERERKQRELERERERECKQRELERKQRERRECEQRERKRVVPSHLQGLTEHEKEMATIISRTHTKDLKEMIFDNPRYALEQIVGSFKQTRILKSIDECRRIYDRARRDKFRKIVIMGSRASCTSEGFMAQLDTRKPKISQWNLQSILEFSSYLFECKCDKSKEINQLVWFIETYYN